MPYQRSLEIEQRLGLALRLIRDGRYSTPKLAEELSVSIPTVSRYVSALRQRGFEIRAERRGSSWNYVLFRPRKSKRQKLQTLAYAAESR